MGKAERDLEHLRQIVKAFPNVRILVVGDVMLDEFVWGKVSRISPEAPIPVVRVSSETCVPGGAANVAANLSNLGASVELAGVIGKDIEARTLKKELKLRNVRCGGLVAESGRTTTLKRRIIADSQQVVRMDREAAEKITAKTMERLLDYCRKIISNVDGIIISDYGKGVVTKKLVRELRKLKGKRNLPVAVDPKTSHFDIYRWVTVITPNCSEVEQNQHFVIDTDRRLLNAGRRLVKSLACDAILITRGEEGMSLFERSGAVTHIPTVAREVYDVTGAGDTVTGVLTLSLACGASMREAAVISNYAAGVVVGKRGTALLNREELMGMIGVTCE